jgi:ABC-type phosphate/phosphonate transport system substrate-binding protein
MIASLPMYDLPEIRRATEEWWQGLSRYMGLACPLDWGVDYRRPWGDPQLVLSQTCGYPLTHDFRGRLRVLATPHYEADGCDGPLYCSIVLAREAIEPAQLRGRVAAFNSPDSMSGALALKLVFAPYARGGRFFSRAISTGSHLDSLAAVRSGEADVCAVDAVTLALLRLHRPEALDSLVEIGRSPHVPALPYVTSAARPRSDVARFREAIMKASGDPALAAPREALLLKGFSMLDDADYDRILILEADIGAAGELILQ